MPQGTRTHSAWPPANPPADRVQQVETTETLDNPTSKVTVSEESTHPISVHGVLERRLKRKISVRTTELSTLVGERIEGGPTEIVLMQAEERPLLHMSCTSRSVKIRVSPGQARKDGRREGRTHFAQEMLKLATTRSPGLTFVTSGPTDSTNPMTEDIKLARDSGNASRKRK